MKLEKEQAAPSSTDKRSPPGSCSGFFVLCMALGNDVRCMCRSADERIGGSNGRKRIWYYE
jgi:hypothetical protein